MPNQYIPPPDEAYPGLRALGDAYLASQSAREGIFGRLEYHPQQQQQQQARQQRGNPRITPVPVPVPIPVQSHQQQFAERAAALEQQQRHFAGQQDEARPFDGTAATGQFGILAPDDGMDASGSAGAGPIVQTGGKLPVRMVVAPPDLQAWREKLFHVDDVIVLTQEEFETYFPHVDNVYSHRSTQKYKRKPFISHYWDCRMKGRPPGTPKTDDPSKKRRRRSARERDLCDVKIKITEYFPGSEAYYQAENGGASSVPLEGQKFWTIQRVNGNGGNGKGDGVAGPHKHTLERSDEIKKNSVQRWMAAQDREVKGAGGRRASGAALATIKRHAKDADIKFHAACYCPFSQRVWIALQAKGLAYQYVETDPLRQKAGVLKGNPRGKVPSVKQGDWTCAESWVILEYLDELDPRVPLLPADAKMTATCRLWIDHVCDANEKSLVGDVILIATLTNEL
ncbi:Putative Glutathione S-transferase [[Torrubiella] hemipterigena]|uniref:Putative Glutathione S-transferase n=1 Tax=[Torrubiella] hemipterigena TaxID=1531966 RepID=A0A0A1T893_9HYPO|nr:Putative Glutathione S-transferase [[Torrubiella] hemipterigena]